MDWKAALGLKKKSRREKVQDQVSDLIHKVADTLDEQVARSREQAPKVAQQAQTQLEETGERAREQASEVVEQLGAVSQKQLNAALAALGGLTADWDELLVTLEARLQEEKAARQGEPKTRKSKGKRTRAYPGFWIWLLRLGVGFWFIERLRHRDLAAYIDHGAGEELRQQSKAHPVEWYKDLLDTLLIPNASLVALLTVAIEGMVALGYLTGVNRRLAALGGITLAGNELMAHHNDPERGEELLLLLAQLLLLRTGG